MYTTTYDTRSCLETGYWVSARTSPNYQIQKWIFLSLVINHITRMSCWFNSKIVGKVFFGSLIADKICTISYYTLCFADCNLPAFSGETTTLLQLLSWRTAWLHFRLGIVSGFSLILLYLVLNHNMLFYVLGWNSTSEGAIFLVVYSYNLMF